MFPIEFNNYDCFDILRNRPWYGQINSWFWLLSTPAMVFLINPSLAIWKKTICAILIVAISYIVINLATHLGDEIRNAAFHHEEVIYSNGVLQSGEEGLYKYNCFNSADGGNYVFALLFGWIPASLYVGFWLFAMWVFRKIRSVRHNNIST